MESLLGNSILKQSVGQGQRNCFVKILETMINILVSVESMMQCDTLTRLCTVMAMQLVRLAVIQLLHGLQTRNYYNKNNKHGYNERLARVV